MEKTKKLFSKKWRALAAIFFLAAFATNVQAQDVTIRGNNGSCVAAVKNGGAGDTYFRCGGFATWQHEQLSMVLTTSDGTVLTPNGQLDNPANNLFSVDGKMRIAKGQFNGRSPYTGDNAPANVCYVSLSLPKGYRFTSYTITFSRPADVNIGTDSNNRSVYLNPTQVWNDGISNAGNDPVRFGETNSSFNTYTTSATIAPNGANQTISRTTEGADGTMGNVLYFKLEGVNQTNIRSMIQLETARFYFTAEENYSPVTPAGEITSPVSAVDIPFATSKVDFGAITSNRYQGVDRISYSSANVKDLEANFMLYEAESITDGKDIDNISGKVVDYKEGSISSDGGYFKLGSGDAEKEQVYFLEAPSNVEVSSGVKVPVGYRITAAELEYNTKAGENRTFYITYVDDYTTYYLYTNGNNVSWQTRGDRRTVWEMDADGYIKSASGYYLVFNQAYAGVQREKPGESERYAIGEDGIYQIGWPDYYIRWYRQNWYSTPTCLVSNTSGTNATYTEITPSVEPVSNYTLLVYDKEGKNPQEITVTGHGTTSLNGLNNDAIKFGVKGTGLVRATLTLQALDPYLRSMKVICNDLTKPQIKIHDTFTASDFSVSGGEFYFYLPADCKNDDVKISFEDLKSDYFDETYPGGNASHTSRLNFVKSEHYNAFNKGDENVIYQDVSEAADAKLERRKVDIGGTKKFKFNNAEDVDDTFDGVLEEYAFSLGQYKKEGGDFATMEYKNVTEKDQVETRYIFTTDETRYNIAPTTAIQHRAYAYYEMIVHVSAATYEPEVEFVPIYDPTLYGTGQTDAFYGAKVTAYAGGKPGYSSTQEIFKIIKEKIADASVTVKPTDPSKLLYLDFSKLAGVYEITDSENPSMEDYSASNAKNCMIFLPEGHSAPNNNVSAKIDEGIFLAAHNIVLTDKEPFYSPYDIQVGSENKIEYKRLITKDKYGKVQNASLILPFALKLEGGKHTNADGSSFTLHTMQSSQALKVEDDKVVAFFPAMTGVSSVAANTPYLVQIDSNSSADGVTFTVSQTGGTISKSTSMAADYTFSGAASTGVTADKGEGAGTFTFTPKGTYAGQKVAKANNIFYFAKNMFVSSKDLDDSYGDVKIAPFRAYYATSSNGAKLASFTPVFEEGEGDVITAIAPVAAVIDVNAPVYDLQGRMVATSYSELNGKKLAAGMYVVNGVKFIVK